MLMGVGIGDICIYMHSLYCLYGVTQSGRMGMSKYGQKVNVT